MSGGPVATELELIRQAQSDVEQARRLLARPTARSVEESVPYLAAAIRGLEGVQASSQAVTGVRGREIATQLVRLRDQIGGTRILLERAASFYFGWGRLLYAAACGYTPDGQPASPAPARRMSVEG